MIAERRLHLSLSESERAALRDDARQRLGLTMEQAAILSLLDRVEALEMTLARLGGARTEGGR